MNKFKGLALNIKKCCTNTHFESGCISFLNLYSILQLKKSGRNYSELTYYCDGFFMSIAVFLVSGLYPKRTSFDYTSMATWVFELANSKKSTIYLIGSEESINIKFCEYVKCRYPDINIVGRSSGYLDNTERASIIEDIIILDPDVLIVGMGAPHQDDFLVDVMSRGYKGSGFTCGGFMHQTVMVGGAYYPSWVNFLNLRFAYRMFKEPYTIKRYFIQYPASFLLFIGGIFTSKIKLKVIC